MLLLLRITGFQNHGGRSWPTGRETGWQGVIGTGFKKKSALVTRALEVHRF